ncbi:hypothetical protein KJ742_02420 [Patescibacteria group bacterium]|nr:hypothetical protein [Patescibacteria group bacterium]
MKIFSIRRIFLLIILVILISSQIISCNHQKTDEIEYVADKFLRATAANDLADILETSDPGCQNIENSILLQIGLSALVGGSEFEYVELIVQTIDNDDIQATVHVEGKLKGIVMGTQVIIPVDSIIPLKKIDDQWYVTCDYNNQNTVVHQENSDQMIVSQNPGEKIIDNWKLLILETKELESYGRSHEESSEGYKLFGIHLSVENLSNEMAELWIGGLGTFFCEDDRGFTYDLLYLTTRNRLSEFPISALNPPNYRINGWLACEVPTSASIKYLVINKGNTEIRFDLENIDPNNLNFPTDNPNLMSIGESLTQNGVFSVKPLRAFLFPGDYTRQWELYVELSVENLYGYEYGADNLEMQIYDDNGYTNHTTFYTGLDYAWPDSIKEKNGNIRNIYPGFKDSGFISSLIGEVNPNETEPPTGLKLLIYMPKPDGPVDAEPVYGLYDLDNLTIIYQ